MGMDMDMGMGMGRGMVKAAPVDFPGATSAD
jgi:hypothetical protein